MKNSADTYNLDDLILIAIDNLGYSASGAPIKKSLAAVGWQVKAKAFQSSLGELEQKGLVFSTMRFNALRHYRLTREGFVALDRVVSRHL